MSVKTILNRIQQFKGFVYAAVGFGSGSELTIEVELRPRRGNRPICSGCGAKRPGYDTSRRRRFEFVPLWGIPVFFIYAMRRVSCPDCGVVVERIPWAEGKHHVTNAYVWFLARWARRLSWSEAAAIFKTSWETVFRSVERAVTWGLEHRDLSRVEAIGVDEILWQRGHKYLTVVYQIDKHCKRLLWVGRERTRAALEGFFELFGETWSRGLKYVCSDMWGPYLDAIREKATTALNVLDRYHIVSKLNQVITDVRAKEAKDLKRQGLEPVLKGTRWCLLKRPTNLTEKQECTLGELLKYNLKTVRAYLLKEELDFFWHYVSRAWAEKFLERWCTRAMRSRIEPLKSFVGTLRNHWELVFNWFKARDAGVSLGAVEGLNNKAKVTMRRAYGFRTFKAAEIALYHSLGALPEPKLTHRFC